MEQSAIKIKYIRSYHLPYSQGVQSDDKIIETLEYFEDEEVVVSEKLDGECTTCYTDGYHARSLDSVYNFTRSWVATMHSCMRFLIPNDIKLVGENLWGKHTIGYPDNYLEGYFYLFSVWQDLEDGTDFCLDYDSIIEYANKLDLPTPKVLYRGIYSEKILKELAANIDTDVMEGFVVRTVKGFRREDSTKYLAKWVRKDHVQINSEHWLKNVEKNGELNSNTKPSYMKK